MAMALSPDIIASKASKVLQSFVQTNSMAQLLERSAGKTKPIGGLGKASYASPIKLNNKKMKRANSEQVFQIRGVQDKMGDHGSSNQNVDTLPSIHKNDILKQKMVKLASQKVSTTEAQPQQTQPQ